MRRVVVTGLGLVTPLEVGVDFVWDNLIKGNSGISKIENFDTEDLPVKIAAQIPRGGDSDPIILMIGLTLRAKKSR